MFNKHVNPSPQFDCERLIGGVAGPLPRAPLRAAYRTGIVLGAAVSILLPLLYLAVVLTVLSGLLHLITGQSFLETVYYTFHRWDHDARTALGFYYHRGSSKIFLFYLMVLLAEAVVLFFLLKSFWTQRPKRMNAVALKPELQPGLFAFVEKICLAVDVPMPARIEMDCQPNAAVDFYHGILRNDLVLRIGLPLAAGLDVREFAGVVAHELGHFSQGSGLRLAYIIRELDKWMERIVYGRDAWDDWLEDARSDPDRPTVFWVGNIVGALVAVPRVLFMPFLWLARLCNNFLLRQMEFQADDFEIKLAGSEAFESTTQRLVLLTEANERAHLMARTRWNLGRHLPDNLPAYVVSHLEKMPAAVRAIAQAGADAEEGGPVYGASERRGTRGTGPASGRAGREFRGGAGHGDIRGFRPAGAAGDVFSLYGNTGFDGGKLEFAAGQIVWMSQITIPPAMKAMKSCRTYGNLNVAAAHRAALRSLCGAQDENGHPVPKERILALPPGRGLQAASPRNWHGIKRSVLWPDMLKRHKCRAPRTYRLAGQCQDAPVSKSHRLKTCNSNEPFGGRARLRWEIQAEPAENA